MQTQQPKYKTLMAVLTLTLLLSFTSVCHAANNLSNFNTICDWLEVNLPDYFSPMGVQTSETSGFLVRYYQDTNTYVGTINGDFYVFGSAFGNEVVNVGTMEHLLSLINPVATTCDSNHLDLCGGSNVCVAAGGYWYDYKCHSAPKPVTTCDSNHLDLCGGSNVCVAAGGYWYDYKCHSAPKPVTTCNKCCSYEWTCRFRNEYGSGTATGSATSTSYGGGCLSCTKSWALNQILNDPNNDCVSNIVITDVGSCN